MLLIFIVGGCKMSKVYRQYLDLKEKDESKSYLFHSGIFYIFLAEDAEKLGPLLELKQTRFTDSVDKCGFPENSKSKYLERLDQLNISYEIIEKEVARVVVDQKLLKKLSEIQKINCDELTPIMALKMIYELQEVLS